MKAHAKHRFLCLLLTVFMLVSLFPAAALAVDTEQTPADHVVINQVYGGGGNSGAVYTNDFIELYNPTDEDVSLDGWTIQYASKTGDFKANSATARMVTELTGTIKAHGYYLIQEAAGNTPVKDLPTPDAVDTIAMAGKEFKIALVNGTAVIKDNNDASVVDFLGIGAADMYETEPAAVISNSTAAIRVVDGVDTDNNKADFKADTPNPRNSASSGETTEPTTEPVVTVSTVKQALDGAAGTEFTVKGVVTLVDGQNLYLQDETGGICLRCATAPADVALGDTIIGTGSRADYRGMAQLSNGTYSKDEGLTLSAKDTAIGALTTADVCTYVKISDVEVTEVYDNNGAYTSPNITVKDASGATIQIYKAVIGKTDGEWDVKVGDIITICAAVGINNTTLQLRNTVADEIVVKEAPYKDVPANLSVYELTDSIADGDRILVVNTANNKTLTTEPAATYYLAGADVAPQELDGAQIIALDNDTAEWTVAAGTEEGVYTLSQGDKVLAGNRENYTDNNGNQKTRVNITLVSTDSTGWKLADFGESGVFLVNAGVASAKEGGNVSLEWYNNRFCLYDIYPGNEAKNSAACAVTFYKLVREKTVETPETPTAAPAAGAVEAGTEVTFSCATEGAVISYSTDNGATWTEGTTLTVTEAVTVLVKAAKDGAESEVASFAYTIKSDEPAGESGLVTDLSQLTDGAYVVIYHPDSGLAMTSETYRDWYLMGSPATITEGKAIDPAASQVWKVSVNSDGSYTFTQGSYTVAAWLDGTYVELTNNGSYNADTANGWKLDVCNAENSTFYMSSSTLTTTYGGVYVEVYGKKVNNVSGTKVFCGYSTSAEKLTEAAYGMQFYLVDEPETPADKGDLVTNLDDMVGKTVAIYSPGHQTAISSKPNGDWYLKAQNATVEDGKVLNFTSDFVWTVVKNDDGTYSFVSYDDPTKIIGVWPSGNYAEVTVNPREDAATAWTLTPAKTADCFYISSPTVSSDNGPAYIEAYVRNEFEVFSGYFTKPTSNKFTENEFALQFYLVDPADAVAAMDDGEWDGVLTKGAQYVIYNVDAQSSIGLFDEANFSMKAIPTTITGDKAKAGNGAYVFTVDTMGRYYTFMTGGKFLATNNDEELFLIDPNADGSAPETAKWFLNNKGSGYILYNKEASYNGTPVCIEYYSSVFSGWTFSTKNPLNIYLFNFYPVADGTKVYNDIVQDPSVTFDGENARFIEQDYTIEATLDDLAPDITSVKFTYTVGDKTGEITNVTGNERTYSLTIPAAELDTETGATSFTVKAEVTNSYGITYTGEKTVTIVDEPFFANLLPRPNSQTGENKRPVISVKIGNVGTDPAITMKVNGKTVEATFADGVLTYTPDADMADGRVTVDVSVKRADGKTAEKSWSFTVGSSAYQHYFGQLHSHTTYSDGSGTLDAALEYIASLPKSANVQFVAFTDHSNYFDTTSAANPADALNDKSLMTDASREKWDTYKNTVAVFNDSHDDIKAIAGFEMTWSGGPGHINTYDSDGLVSRNNAELNNKSGDAGMRLYYQTINKGDSLNQFNHPGTTFGNFTDFSYYDAETDQHMFLVEVGNGEGQIGAGGYYPSYEQYTLALDKGWHVAPTNNQDNHKGRWGNANDARDVVLATELSEEAIYDAIRSYRVYATEDKNLDLNYTVNDEPMGTIFTEAPEKLEVKVNVFDPDTHESVQKVELVANSGKVAYTWDNAAEIATGELTATLDPSFSYYYVRVTQADGDLAVTAPVWVGDSISVGIQDVKCDTEQPIVNETIKLQTTLFNNESSDVKVKSLVYTTDGSKVLGTDTKGYTIKANGTVDVPFEFTTDVAKRMTIKVTAVIEVNGGDLTYTKDITISVRENAGDLPVTDIKTVQAQTEAGYEYAIEGVVTSNASGYDKDTAFFDCIYVQDETGGICCFPVSGEFKIGDKVHIEGYTDFYQGEAELQVEKIEIIGSGEVTPTETTAAAVNDGSVRGSLITVKGTVESFEVVNGLVQTIMVKDAKGDVVRVFIDGYITTGNEVENLENGCEITVTGLASYDDTFNAPDGPFPRIRIRDRADVVCTPKAPEKCDGGDSCPSKEFTDVDRTPDSWYHEAVDWAVVAKVTNGTSKTTFSPDSACTRAQAVTLLYRAMGEPAVKATKCDFVDVPTDAYYYKAVLWAVENGITNGVDPTHFAPDATCTRAHIVTFLFRAEKGTAGTANPFVDVPAGQWYTDAVLWANAEGITNGTDPTHFSPMNDCTRAHIVTFLWRDITNK